MSADYPLPAAVRLLTFPDGERRMFDTAKSKLLAANDPRPLGLDISGWTHNWTPRLLYRTRGGRYVSRYYQGRRDDRFEAVDLEEATRLFEVLHFQGCSWDQAFGRQFEDA